MAFQTPVTIFHIAIDEREYFDSLPEFIKRRKDGIEIILLFNAYQLENKRQISKQEEEQLAKKENIKYCFEISSKNDVELLLKKILCICFHINDKNNLNKIINKDINKGNKNKKNKGNDCISF